MVNKSSGLIGRKEMPILLLIPNAGNKVIFQLRESSLKSSTARLRKLIRINSIRINLRSAISAALTRSNMILFPAFGIILFMGVSTLSADSLQKPASSVPGAMFNLTRLQTDEDEIKIVEQLISSTKELLHHQEHLKDLMVQFQKYKEEFTQGTQTKSHTARLIRLGREIYELITAEHFEHLFAKDYLDELQFFSSIAGKKSLGKQ